MKKLPTWISAPLVLAAFGALVWLERKRPLRAPDSEPKLRRDVRNLGIASLGGVVLSLAEAPLTAPLTRLVEKRKWGLVPALRLPPPAETLLAVVALDYTLYLWHVLTHRVPLLWRFHSMHHADLDLDASTALRFHFVELLLSVPWRLLQILLIGVSPLSLSVWQTILLVSVLFHHSNVEIPIEWERRLNFLLVTPRMHGIHHSVVPAEMDSNWSSGLAVWDWLHGTLCLDVPQDQVAIGIPQYPYPLGLLEAIIEPFEKPIAPNQAHGTHASEWREPR